MATPGVYGVFCSVHCSPAKYRSSVCRHSARMHPPKCKLFEERNINLKGHSYITPDDQRIGCLCQDNMRLRKRREQFERNVISVQNTNLPELFHSSGQEKSISFPIWF